MFPVKQLYDLQTVDKDIESHNEELALIQVRLDDDSAIRSLRASVQGLEAYLSARTTERRESEFQVQGFQERIDGIDVRLMSGSVTNIRELGAYEDQKAMLNRQKGEAENVLLEIMVDMEERQAQRDNASEQLTQLESTREQETVVLLARRGTLRDELQVLTESRDLQASDIGPAALSLYETVAKARAGVAVAKVERGVCQGCRIAVPNRELLQARSSERAVQCGSCRRILFVE